MKASEALDHLYSVAQDDELLTLDDLMVRAGFRTPLNDQPGQPVTGGEMRPVDHNSIETLEELRDTFVPH